MPIKKYILKKERESALFTFAILYNIVFVLLSWFTKVAKDFVPSVSYTCQNTKDSITFEKLIINFST